MLSMVLPLRQLPNRAEAMSPERVGSLNARSAARPLRLRPRYRPATAGSFLNVRDARWLTTGTRAGRCASFESPESEFPQLGIGLHVLEPGQPTGLYHSESQQEAFLVLFGECTLLVEGTERPPRAVGLLPQSSLGRSTSSSEPATGRA